MGKISIYDIAKILVDKNGLTKSESEQFVAAIFDVIQEGLEHDSLVKVKGLGTFKIIGVEARESVNVNTGERVVIESHEKVTFTPDAVMKELVNKPFSQFETVVLNDGIEFDDILEDKPIDSTNDDIDNCSSETLGHDKNSVVSEEIEYTIPEKKSKSESSEKKVENSKNEEPIEITEPDINPKGHDDCFSTTESHGTVETEVVNDSSSDTMVLAGTCIDKGPDTESDIIISSKKMMLEEDSAPSTDSDGALGDECQRNGLLSWIVFAIISVILILLSFYGGYRYGIYVSYEELKPRVIIKKIVVHPSDSLQTRNVDSITVQQRDSVTTDSIGHNDDKSHVEGVKTVIENTEDDFLKYAEKDVRVRTGAYRIVGTDRILTVRKGETLASIARRTLGNGMSCYIEVYNDLNENSELKDGQKIKIPKLKLKRKKGN